MDIRKQLVVSIIKFLKSENESCRLGDDGSEALEVAVQCLENAYNTEGITNHEADLLTIYQSAIYPGNSFTHIPPPVNNPASTSTHIPSTSNAVSEADKEQAEMKKIEGNNFMRDGKYTEAVGSYTRAIELDPNNAIYYSNRAASYAKLNENKNSIVDCKKALEIEPSYSKAYGRMGLAYFNDENYEKAIDAYEKALTLDPANHPYRVQVESAREKINQRQNPGGLPQCGATAAPPNPLAGMDLSSLLSNPAVMNMAQNFMQNPQVQNMFQNMMGGAPNGAAPGSNPQGATAADGAPNGSAESLDGAGAGAGAGFAGPGGFGAGFDLNTVLNATSHFATQMRQENPEVVENLRAQFRQEQPPNPDSTTEKKEDTN